MTPEAKVKASVVKLLKQYEVYYFFPATHGFGRSGVPDIVCCLEGNFLAIECKAGDNKPTALQQRELQRIANAGGDTFVINEENIHILEAYLMTVPTEEDKPMLKNLVHDQVKILLERMETHPEEFFTPRTLGDGKWDPFMPGSSIFRHFTKLEQYLIRRKYCKARDKIYRQQAYDGILETLVFKEEPTNIERYYSTSNQPVLGTPTYTMSTPPTITGTINANGLTLGSETLDAETIKHMEEHIKAIRKEQMRMGEK